MLMSGRSLIFVLAILVWVAALVAPLLVDAHHWWPRKQMMLKAGQALRAAVFLLCIFLGLGITSGFDGTEFSGGWLSRRLLSMTDIGTVLFGLALMWIFFSQRVAATIGLLSSLFCLPLYCFFIAPAQFAGVFVREHGLAVQPAPGFHWHSWPVAALLAVFVAGYLSIRDLAARPSTRQVAHVHPANG